jgi:glutathione synthase/RimK-type ligase-like ATP-grasp enzyme
VIVVISHPGDLHATQVLERLRTWGREVRLFDVADLPGQATLTIDYADPVAPRVRLDHRRDGPLELSDATAVWWRRPQIVQLDSISDAPVRGFVYGEWHEALNGAYHLMRCPWMNPPLSNELASRKPHQLRVASEIGLRIPDTLMTSDAAAAAEFVERHGADATIYKIFSATQEIWRETRVVRADDLEHLSDLAVAPVIFQELIPAVADVRVTIVGDSLFAIAIDSRGTSYEVDFRVSLAEARINATVLPDDVAAHLHELLRRLDIVYGAIDLRVTPEGEYVFLEVNPAGEFLFVEAATGLPITETVAGWLASPA